MAINSVEIVSLLEKINLATINNPKVLQNAVKAIELISNSSNPSIRQKALIFQEKLKENPTFIELNKKEEIKQAEIQQERSERMQEQFQAKKAASAGDKIEKEKKEERQEKLKEQELKTLLNSGGFSSLPLWQQLDVLDYAFTHYDSLSNQEKIKVCDIALEDYRNEPVAEEKQTRYENYANNIVNKRSENTGNSFTVEQIAGTTNPQVAHKELLFTQEADARNVKLSNEEKKERVTIVYTEITKSDFANNLFFKSKSDQFKLSFNENGTPEILELVNGQWVKSTHPVAISFLEQDSKKLEAAQSLVKDESGLNVLNEEKNAKIKQLSAVSVAFNTTQDLFSVIGNYYHQVNKDTEKLKQQGIFNSEASDHCIALSAQTFLFSDVIKSNQDTTMAFHIAMKNFVKEMDKNPNERDVKAYELFAQCDFVQELLNKGKNGEIMLRQLMENQWWTKAECDEFIPKMRQIMQESDFQQKVEQAKQHNISIDEFRKQYPDQKLQDSLVAYFRTEPKFKEKFNELANAYPENGAVKLYNKLIGMDNKELKRFIEKETGLNIEPEQLKPYLRDRGLTKESEINKVLDNNELGEEAKQENVVKNDLKDVGKDDDFFNGYRTKEQVEQTISDNSKRLGYETANPSKPQNQEENNNTMRNQQSISSSNS